MKSGLWFINKINDSEMIFDSYIKNNYLVYEFYWSKYMNLKHYLSVLLTTFWFKNQNVEYIDVKSTITKFWDFISWNNEKIVFFIYDIDLFLLKEERNNIEYFNSMMNDIRFNTSRFDIIRFLSIQANDLPKNRIITDFSIWLKSWPLEYMRIIIEWSDLLSKDVFLWKIWIELGINFLSNRDGFIDIIDDNLFFVIRPLCIFVSDKNNIFSNDINPIKEQTILEEIITKLWAESMPVYLVYT